MKTCCKCHGSGPFGRDKSRKDGLAPVCKSCCREKAARFREAHRDRPRKTYPRRPRTEAQKAKHRASMKRWRDNNPERHQAYTASIRSNILLSRSRAIARKFGIMPMAVVDGAALQAWVDKQPKHCRLCRSAAKRLCIDHCHTTGRLRGMLCTHCNRLVGIVEKYDTLLTEARAYLSEQTPVIL